MTELKVLWTSLGKLDPLISFRRIPFSTGPSQILSTSWNSSVWKTMKWSLCGRKSCRSHHKLSSAFFHGRVTKVLATNPRYLVPLSVFFPGICHPPQTPILALYQTYSVYKKQDLLVGCLPSKTHRKNGKQLGHGY